MPQEHLEAGEVDEAEEVLDVVFPSGDESAEATSAETLTFPNNRDPATSAPNPPYKLLIILISLLIFFADYFTGAGAGSQAPLRSIPNNPRLAPSASTLPARSNNLLATGSAVFLL